MYLTWHYPSPLMRVAEQLDFGVPAPVQGSDRPMIKIGMGSNPARASKVSLMEVANPETRSTRGPEGASVLKGDSLRWLIQVVRGLRGEEPRRMLDLWCGTGGMPRAYGVILPRRSH